jgi:hypothetical protein
LNLHEQANGFTARRDNTAVAAHPSGLVAGPRVERGSERLMRPPGPPGLPAGTSDHGSLKLVESRELESHTSRCHRVSKPRRRACPVDSPWRKAAVPIRSARAPNPFPTGAGPCPVHFPNWRRAGALEAHAFRHHRRSKPRRSPDRFTLPNWPARQDSNLHPRVPETRARPIELRAMKNGAGSAGDR